MFEKKTNKPQQTVQLTHKKHITEIFLSIFSKGQKERNFPRRATATSACVYMGFSFYLLILLVQKHNLILIIIVIIALNILYSY